MLVALQVVFAIMSVSPHELRLSDETIAKAIVDFYKSSNLLPPGISVSALSDWAGKMAHGARKVTGKFRRLYAATPENSKDPALRDLKFRCQEAGIPTAPGCDNSDKSADSRPASHEDLEEVSCSAPSWTEALKNKLLAKNKEKEAAQKQAATARPVATPSRNSHEVPKFVLDKLAEKTPEVAPFVATAAEEEPVVREPGKDKKKEGTKVQEQKKKAEITGPEVEAALQLEEPVANGQSKAEAAPASRMAEDSGELSGAIRYSPKKFSAAKKAFIVDIRAKDGLNYQDALAAWMRSDLRSEYLETVPEKELKRRRFM